VTRPNISTVKSDRWRLTSGTAAMLLSCMYILAVAVFFAWQYRYRCKYRCKCLWCYSLSDVISKFILPSEAWYCRWNLLCAAYKFFCCIVQNWLLTDGGMNGWMCWLIWFICSHIHSFTHHSFTHLLIQTSFIHLFTHHLCTHSFIHSFIHTSFIHSHIVHSFIHSFIHTSFMYSFIHLFPQRSNLI